MMLRDDRVKQFAVIVAPEVEEQITAQVLHIAADSLGNALVWEARLRSAILAIGETPGQAVDEQASDRLGYIVHKVVFERTYLIHFVVDERAATVRIVNFRHGARLPTRGEP
jgi:plasmid stabilization system protein ParE